jgi:hypothetical protein
VIGGNVPSFHIAPGHVGGDIIHQVRADCLVATSNMVVSICEDGLLHHNPFKGFGS